MGLQRLSMMEVQEMTGMIERGVHVPAAYNVEEESQNYNDSDYDDPELCAPEEEIVLLTKIFHD
jgi:hypothetical protein